MFIMDIACVMHILWNIMRALIQEFREHIQYEYFMPMPG